MNANELIDEKESEDGWLSNDLRFNFNVRLINILRAENVFTLDELLAQSAKDLMKFPNMGKVSVGIIKEQLAKHKLKLVDK